MAAMHFWGIEVKGKEPKSVTLEEGQIIHISQATLGELKKDKEPVIIHLKVGDKKLVMGILSQNAPQLSFDLVFDQAFEISHNWKNGSVHFLGYDSDMPEEENIDFSDDEDVPATVPLRENGKAPAQKDKKVKPESNAEEDDENDSDDDDDDSEDDDESDEDLDAMADDDDSSDGDGSVEEEETPKPDPAKKRKSVVVKTPEAKKAKLASPQKTDGKKGVAHTATPHPSKKGGKSGDKSTPKAKISNKAKHAK